MRVTCLPKCHLPKDRQIHRCDGGSCAAFDDTESGSHSVSMILMQLQAPSLEARLRNIVEALTFDVYNYTCLSLFECHKLMFSFQVSTQ